MRWCTSYPLHTVWLLCTLVLEWISWTTSVTLTVIDTLTHCTGHIAANTRHACVPNIAYVWHRQNAIANQTHSCDNIAVWPAPSWLLKLDSCKYCRKSLIWTLDGLSTPVSIRQNHTHFFACQKINWPILNVSGLTLAIVWQLDRDTKQPVGKMSFTTKVHVM